MPIWPEPQRDSFDQWVSQILTAGTEASPSHQVWRRIVRAARASQIWGVWRKQGNSQSFTTWSTWYEQRKRPLDMQLISMGWGMVYSKLLRYT